MKCLFFPTRLVVSVFGCAEQAEKIESVISAAPLKAESQPEIKQEAPKVITSRVTVRYKNIEDGFWGEMKMTAKSICHQNSAKRCLLMAW